MQNFLKEDKLKGGFKTIKKAIVLLLMNVLLLINMCACGNSSEEPSGKYYGEEFDEVVYYEFDFDFGLFSK